MSNQVSIRMKFKLWSEAFYRAKSCYHAEEQIVKLDLVKQIKVASG